MRKRGRIDRRESVHRHCNLVLCIFDSIKLIFCALTWVRLNSYLQYLEIYWLFWDNAQQWFIITCKKTLSTTPGITEIHVLISRSANFFSALRLNGTNEPQRSYSFFYSHFSISFVVVLKAPLLKISLISHSNSLIERHVFNVKAG
jgi:hypothetical protein